MRSVFLTCCLAVTLSMATPAVAQRKTYPPLFTATPTRTPYAPVYTVTPTPTRTVPPQVTPIPVAGLVRVTIEIQPQGQPWSKVGSWEIQTSDWEHPCELLVQSPCLVEIRRK